MRDALGGSEKESTALRFFPVRESLDGAFCLLSPPGVPLARVPLVLLETAFLFPAWWSPSPTLLNTIVDCVSVCVCVCRHTLVHILRQEEEGAPATGQLLFLKKLFFREISQYDDYWG